MPYIAIDRERCKGCYFCIQFCPKNIITKEDEINRLGYFPARFDKENEDKCTGCKTCAQMCPDLAIEVFK